MSTHTFKWARGKLPEGLSSIAQHLGLRPDEVLFMCCLVVNPEGKCWRLRSVFGKEFLLTQFVQAMCGPGSTALVFPMRESQRDYWQRFLQDGGKLIEIPPIGEGRFYPQASLVAALWENSHSARVKSLLQGKVIANSYVTEEVEKLAQTFGGRTLMSSDTFARFLGKDYLHKVADQVGMKVPPGIVVHQPVPSSTVIESLQSFLQSRGIDPEITSIWIKPSSFYSGYGIVCTPDSKPETLKAGLLSVATTYHRAGFYSPTVEVSKLSSNDPFADISTFMPVVMEADVGQLPWVRKKVDDVAVNAILGTNGVVHIESTLIATTKGSYTGSRLPKASEKALVEVGEVGVDGLLQRMWEEGYRGYVGVDAMVIETHDGELVAYVNDLNTRLCGASPLICMAHKLESRLGYRPTVASMTCKVRTSPSRTDPFQEVVDSLGEHLYRAAESGYMGIVPTMPNSISEEFFSFVAIAIARDETHLEILWKTLFSLVLFEEPTS